MTKHSNTTSTAKLPFFWVLMLLIPVAAIVLPELVLRAAGYGETIALFQTFESNPDYYSINPKLGERYFPGKNTRPEVAVTDIFLKQKPADAFRIFVLGASTTAGYPYLYNASFPSMLKIMLREYYPDRRIEVINLAMPAVTSYAVREIALQLDDYQPDMLLIYAGHNEFYGGLGVASTASLGGSRWLVNTYLRLRDFRLVQLISSGMAGVRQMFAGSAAGESGTLMQRMVQDRAIAYRSDLFDRAGEIFRGNIGDVLDHCRDRNLPVMIGTLVSNIRDQQPFVDVFSEEQRKIEWQQQIAVAKQLYEKQQFSEAAIAVKSAIAIDSLPASQYFLQGQILEASGDSAAAYAAFYRAKEFDGLRFRASEVLNQIIEKFGESSGVGIVPIREMFEAQSPGNLPGRALLLEHLHPNVDGYLLMATTFAESIIQSGVLGEPVVATLPDSLWRQRIGVSELDKMVGDLRIDYLKSGWPFQPDAPLPQAEFPVPNAADPVVQLVRQFWLGEINWEAMHVKAAELFRSREQWEKAAAEYRALAIASEINPSPYIFLADMLIRLQQFDEALAALKKAVAIEPNATSYQQIGRILLLQKQPSLALPYLQQALQLQPDNPGLYFDLARTWFLQGDLPRANQAIQFVLQNAPDFPNAQQLAHIITSAIKQQP